MPIYTLTTQEGTLSVDQKQVIADKITSIHANATGTPKTYVRVFFNFYPKGDAFAGKAVYPATFLHAQIRKGRSLSAMQDILKKCFYVLQTEGAITSEQIQVALDEIPASQMLMHGKILSDPTSDQEADKLEVHTA